MKILYILIAITLIILEGLFPFHWHGSLWEGEGEARKRTPFKKFRGNHSFLWLTKEYFLNFSLSVVGWTAGYFLIFHRSVFHGDSALLIATSLVFLLGAVGYLPHFIVNRLGSFR